MVFIFFGFLVNLLILKIVPKAALGLIKGGFLKQFSGSQMAFGTILEPLVKRFFCIILVLVSAFKEEGRNFIVSFLSKKATKNIFKIISSS
jgi:hypothetical protein